VASGVASALTQTVTVAATDRSGPLLSLQVIGVALLVAAFATGGLLLSQTAYRGGLGAPLAVVTLANPVAAAAIGLSLLGERLQGGPAGVLLALTGAGLAAWGVLLLTRAAPPGPVPERPGGPGHTGARRPAAEPCRTRGRYRGGVRHRTGPRRRTGAGHGSGPARRDGRPVTVLAPESGSAPAAPALVPRQQGPERLTPW
jgi:hypothetical protein